ncbi:MAG: hypothetical protein CMM01_17240 [Rhodopirellula sp.]|nr:hypothetical protein [Rhodopirellula sp.]OUX50088.1 MAG: hypothetical protein CBE43_07980 [Rhodopirellula sp. TMED283]
MQLTQATKTVLAREPFAEESMQMTRRDGPLRMCGAVGCLLYRTHLVIANTAGAGTAANRVTSFNLFWIWWIGLRKAARLHP